MGEDKGDHGLPDPQTLGDLLRDVSFALEHGRSAMVAFVDRHHVSAIGRDFDRMGEVNKQVKAMLEHLPPAVPLTPEQEQRAGAFIAAVLDKRFGDGSQEAVDRTLAAYIEPDASPSDVPETS